MKLFGLAIVLSFFIITTATAQLVKNPILNKMFLKAGIEFSNYSNSGYKSIEPGPYKWLSVFTASIGYEYSKTVDLELEYKHIPEYSYERDLTKELYTPMYGMVYYHTSMNGNVINLRVNYHVDNDRKSDPIYFIGGISLAIEPVVNTSVFKYEDRTEIVTSKYNRYLIGPMAGVGVYYDLGFISFQSEISFGVRVSVINDKKLTETSFNFNFSPIIRL